MSRRCLVRYTYFMPVSRGQSSTLLRNLGFERGFDTAAVAAQTPLRLALGPEVASGTFHANKKAVKCKFADEQGARAALWEACEALAAERLR